MPMMETTDNRTHPEPPESGGSTDCCMLVDDEEHCSQPQAAQDHGSSQGGDDSGDSGCCSEEDMDDDMSEYTYEDSDDDGYAGSDDAPAAVRSGPTTAATTGSSLAAATAGSSSSAAATSARKQANDVSELDRILSGCNAIFPEAINVEDASFLRLITAKDGGAEPGGKASTIAANDGGSEPDKKASVKSSPKKSKPATKEGSASSEKSKIWRRGAGNASKEKTSTLKAGVGYETGSYDKTSTSALKQEMTEASKKQRELDEKCCALIRNLCAFLTAYKGDEGIVLLALKMSIGLNRMIFSLFKNDSLLEWGLRRDVYIAALDLVDSLSRSKFLSSFLLHDLLEGDGSPDHTSNCQILLESLHLKCDVMKRNQEKILAELEKARKGDKPSPEAAHARDTVEVCDKMNATFDKVQKAIEFGRREGTISEVVPDMDMMVDSDDDDAEKLPPSEKEDILTYNTMMKGHRLKHVNLVDAVDSKRTNHTYLGGKVAADAASGAGHVQPRRMLRITSEIAGLSADLPVQWGSGIFVRIDEERPDIMKACIMAPEDTPYENGCFEFDISLPLRYPEEPPKVTLVTTDKNTVRFNPNLYQGGKVCLSLLGTWSGPGWIPETSTLLQVLVSIQSLIFVPDPYFNEPGYDAASPEQQNRSKLYDKQIRAATLKVAILGQMKKPSPLFEECIRDHFRLKKRRLLKQLSDWEELAKEAEGGENPPPASGSVGNPNALVAGGGIKSSQKIVKGLCDEIRRFVELQWPDKKKSKE